MGAIKPGPQGERAISRKAIAQGMPDDRLHLWFLPVLFYRTGAMGEAFTRHSLRPLRLEGVRNLHNSGVRRREAGSAWRQHAGDQSGMTVTDTAPFAQYGRS